MQHNVEQWQQTASSTYHANEQQSSHDSQLHARRQPIKEAKDSSALGLLRAAAAAAAAGSAAHKQPLRLLLLQL